MPAFLKESLPLLTLNDFVTKLIIMTQLTTYVESSSGFVI